MAPRVTSSRDRSGRKPAKPTTVTTSKGRGNRSSVSQARVTNGSNGKPASGGARVTNAGQRTNTGSARVTGGAKPSLPPGVPRPVRASIGNVSGPASTPKPPGTNTSLRPGASRTAPSIPKPSNLSSAATSAARVGARTIAGRALVLPALVSQIADVGKGFQDLANSPFLNKGGTGTTGTRTGRTGRGGTTNDDRRNNKPATDGRYIPGSQQVEIKDRSGRQSVASRAEAPPAPKLPAPVTRSNASSGSGRAGSGSSSTPRRSGPTSTRKASTAPTPPTERRVSASTANRESGNYGTSKTNNPLMKDMIGRIKDREDKAQSSAASKLTSNFGKDSGYQPKDKVDGSGVDTKKKLSSTTNEYNSKKRRYGG